MRKSRKSHRRSSSRKKTIRSRKVSKSGNRGRRWSSTKNNRKSGRGGNTLSASKDCIVLNKNYTREQLVEILVLLGYNYQDYLENMSKEELCELLRKNYPDATYFIKFVTKNYVLVSFNSLLFLLLMFWVASYGSFFYSVLNSILCNYVSTGKIYFDMGTLYYASDVIKEIIIKLYNTGFSSFLTCHIKLLVNIYNAYTKRKVINNIGAEVSRINKSDKIEI